MNEQHGTIGRNFRGDADRRFAARRLLRQALAGVVMAGMFAAANIAQGQSSGPDDSTLSKKQDQMLDGQSGFLGDLYTRLEPDRNKDWLVYIPDPAVLGRDNVFMVEVKVLLAPQVQKQDIPQEDLDKLSDTLRNDMRDQLEKGHYKVVDHAGPGVSTLRLAITNVEPNGGKTNAVVSGSEAVAAHVVVPVPGVSGLAPRLKVGKVSIEGELVESQNGKVEMAFMTSKSGRRFFSGLKAFQKWGDIDSAFKGWSKNFRERLEKAHQQNY